MFSADRTHAQREREEYVNALMTDAYSATAAAASWTCGRLPCNSVEQAPKPTLELHASASLLGGV